MRTRDNAALHRAGLALIFIAALAGCGVGPPVTIQRSAGAPAGDYQRGYRAGYGAGQHAARRRMADDPSFSVSSYELSPCRDEASWLPRRGPIAQITWWRSRGRNLWLLDQCRAKNAAKRAVIFRMLDAVRSHA